MGMTGWIKIHREITEHWIFQDSEKFRWWVDMLFLASYEDNKMLVKNQIANVKRGQFIGSLSFLAKRWCVSRDRVAAFLKLLQSDGMIIKESDKNITQITICNYESYQDTPDTFPTPSLHLPDTSPTPSRQTKEIKEIKEINITTTPRAREESIEWDDNTENSYLERFKAQGSARDAMRMTGKTLREVMEIMDVYRAKRKLQNRGHESYDQFCNLFVWYLEQGKIPQTSAQPQSGVISGQAIFDRIK
jgi:hypothetical protein